MPITELALLRLSNGTTANDPELRSNLLKAKNIMQDFTGHTFYYLQELDDPSHIYVLGEWDTLDQHMKDFIPSAANQSLLEALKDKLTVSWLSHLDIPHASLPLPTTPAQLAQAHSGQLIWSISRYFVPSASKSSFSGTFSQNKHILEAFVTEGIVSGGWRIEKESAEKEEFVLFVPWKSEEQHAEFVMGEDFNEYRKFRDWIQRAEVSHVRLLDI